MSSEPNCCTPEALLTRLVALEKLVDERRIVVNEALHAVQMEAGRAEAKAERASDKAEETASQRAALANEWRGTVNDVIATMVPRSEYTIAHSSLAERLDAVTRRVDQQMGRGMGQTQSIVYIFLASAGIISVAGILIDIFVVH